MNPRYTRPYQTFTCVGTRRNRELECHESVALVDVSLCARVVRVASFRLDVRYVPTEDRSGRSFDTFDFHVPGAIKNYLKKSRKNVETHGLYIRDFQQLGTRHEPALRPVRCPSLLVVRPSVTNVSSFRVFDNVRCPMETSRKVGPGRKSQTTKETKLCLLRYHEKPTYTI